MIVTVGGKSVDIAHVASQLNLNFDLPFVPESLEQAWLEWLVGKIMKVIPSVLITVLSDAADGLTEEELQQHSAELTAWVNSIVDLPMLTESIEEALIRPVVDQLLQFAVSGKALELLKPVG